MIWSVGYIESFCYPANTKHLYKIYTMLEDVGLTLYKCYTNILRFLGNSMIWNIETAKHIRPHAKIAIIPTTWDEITVNSQDHGVPGVNEHKIPLISSQGSGTHPIKNPKIKITYLSLILLEKLRFSQLLWWKWEKNKTMLISGFFDFRACLCAHGNPLYNVIAIFFAFNDTFKHKYLTIAFEISVWHVWKKDPKPA